MCCLICNERKRGVIEERQSFYLCTYPIKSILSNWMYVMRIYLGGGGGSLSVGELGILSTVAYPPPQHEPSNGERSLAL